MGIGEHSAFMSSRVVAVVQKKTNKGHDLKVLTPPEQNLTWHVSKDFEHNFQELSDEEVIIARLSGDIGEWEI